MAKKNITCLTCVRTYLPAIYGNFDRGNDDHKSHFETHPIFRQTRPCGFHGYVPLSFLVSNCFFLGTTINHPCFCHVSTRNDTPGPPPLLVQWYSPAAMARVFINPGAFEAREMGAIKTKYHRDMGYGVKMRI